MEITLTLFFFLFFIEAIIFLALFLESFPFLGAFIPGGIIVVFLAGLFSRTGQLNTTITFLVCLAASFLADLFGYFLGSKYGEKILKKYKRILFIKTDFLHRVCNVVKAHPIKLLVFGKFNPATRSISPFMAGLKKLPPQKFILISITSTLLWVSAFFFMGYLLGKGITTVQALGKWVIISTVILFLLIYLIYLIVSHRREKAKKNLVC